MTLSALITGAAGFVGVHLARFLAETGVCVYGFDSRPAGRASRWCDRWFEGDITDGVGVRALASTIRPDYVFHLAAALKGDSLADYLRVNVIGTECLLDAAADSWPTARVLVTGSAAEYGWVRPADLPIGEESPLRPVGPYGISKVAQSLLAAQYAWWSGLTIIRTRTFNLTGPGEPETLVCSGFAKQIAEIKAGKRPPRIEAGNLEAARDFVDVRDAVRGYWVAAEKGRSGEVYNICSGSSVSIQRLLRMLLDLGKIDAQVQPVKGRFTTWDIPEQVGEASKLKRLTGWTPGFTLDDSLRDLLDDWKDRLAAL